METRGSSDGLLDIAGIPGRSDRDAGMGSRSSEMEK